MSALRLETFSGPAMARMLPALSRLRIAVFRDWPYLYDGDLANEQTYLADFAAAPSAGLVVAFDGDAAVGCSSCLRLAEEDDAVIAFHFLRDAARYGVTICQFRHAQPPSA